MNTAPGIAKRPTLSLFGLRVGINPNVPEDEVHFIQTDPITGAKTRHKIVNLACAKLGA